MTAKYVLSLLSLVFLVAALWRIGREGFKLGPATRTWFVVAAVFGAVSGWLWYAGPGGG